MSAGAPVKPERGFAPLSLTSMDSTPAARRIVFATDLTSASESALDTAIAMARNRDAELVILHVYPRPNRNAVDDLLVPGLSRDIDAAACEEAIEKLEPLLARARRAGICARGLALDGAPERAIASVARSTGAELVVTGTHGRHGVYRFLFGSVTARIVARAPCPVLTVRPA